MPRQISEEVRYRLLKYLAEHPQASQRELARELGISVGKANYCLRALITKGLVKVRNFRNSSNKLAYTCVLTPRAVFSLVDIAERASECDRDHFGADLSPSHLGFERVELE